MKRLLLWVAGLAALGFVLAAATVFFADPVISKAINESGHHLLNVETRVEACHLSLLNGSLTLSGIELKNPEGFKTPRMVHLDQISITVDPSSLLTDRVRVKEVEISGAELTYEAAGFGRSNLSVFVDDLRRRLQDHRSLLRRSTRENDKTIVIDRLHLDGGRVTLSAVYSNGKGIVLPLSSMELRDIGKDRPMGVSAAVTQVLQELGRAALATAGRVEETP